MSKAPIKLGNAIVPARLKSFVERIEKLEEERHAIGGDIRDVYSEAKGTGYDIKIMRKVVSLRKMDAADRSEQEALLDTYLHALGMPDRIEARAAAGESARQIAAAEGVSKSTAHRVSQKAKAETPSAEMGQETSAAPPAEPGLQHRAPVPDGGVGAGTSFVAVVEMRGELVPTNEIGAVASHSDGERVASSNPSIDIFPDLPARLDRRGRSSFSADGKAPYEPVITGSVRGASA